MDEKMQAAKFKSECLKVMEQVKKTRRKIVITKRNVPIAKLVPIDVEDEQVLGKLKGTVHFKDNIIDSIEEDWDADS